MKKLAYGLSIRLRTPFETAKSLVVDALKQEGFGVLTEIDVARTLREKLGVELPPYVILGACNPPLAHAALQADVEIGLLLPCNVVVRQEGDDSLISMLDPLIMAEVSRAPALLETATQAREMIERALGRLTEVSFE